MRYILSLFLFSTYLFALISEPMSSNIISVNDEEETVNINFAKGAQVGMYGVIIKSLDATHEIALKWIEITAIQGELISAKMIPILALEQNALPTGNWVPTAGDKVVLGYNYHRALLIAPNPSVYKKVTTFHKERKWVHPDIFTTILSSHGHPSPLVEDFTSTCRTNNIGTVSFVFDKSIISVDCQSFKIIQNKTISLKTDEIQLPFYTRITHIEANWFGEGNDEVEDYNTYYVDLIAENNPQNEWIQTYKAVQDKENEGSSWFGSWFSSKKVTTGNPEDDDK